MSHRLIAVVATMTLLHPAGSGAHTLTENDGNDKAGKFDITRTGLEHPGDLVIGTVVSGNLQKSDFTGDNYFLWSLDTRGDGDLDYSVFLEARRQNGRLRMRCFILRHDDPPVYEGSVRGKIDGRRGSCRLRPGRVGGLPEHWNSTTSYNMNMDYAPNKGRFDH